VRILIDKKGRRWMIMFGNIIGIFGAILSVIATALLSDPIGIIGRLV